MLVDKWADTDLGTITIEIQLVLIPSSKTHECHKEQKGRNTRNGAPKWIIVTTVIKSTSLIYFVLTMHVHSIDIPSSPSLCSALQFGQPFHIFSRAAQVVKKLRILSSPGDRQ